MWAPGHSLKEVLEKQRCFWNVAVEPCTPINTPTFLKLIAWCSVVFPAPTRGPQPSSNLCSGRQPTAAAPENLSFQFYPSIQASVGRCWGAPSSAAGGDVQKTGTIQRPWMEKGERCAVHVSAMTHQFLEGAPTMTILKIITVENLWSYESHPVNFKMTHQTHTPAAQDEDGNSTQAQGNINHGQ